jgi:RNA recognition motif-containing protein
VLHRSTNGSVWCPHSVTDPTASTVSALIGAHNVRNEWGLTVNISQGFQRIECLSIFISGLKYSVTKDQLHSLICKFISPPFDITFQKKPGTAIVDFFTRHEAEKVAASLNGYTYMGRRIDVRWSKNSRMSRGHGPLIVNGSNTFSVSSTRWRLHTMLIRVQQ